MFCLVTTNIVEVHSQFVETFVMILPFITTMFGIGAWEVSKDRNYTEDFSFAQIGYLLCFPGYLMCPVFLLLSLLPIWVLAITNVVFVSEITEGSGGATG